MLTNAMLPMVVEHQRFSHSFPLIVAAPNSCSTTFDHNNVIMIYLRQLLQTIHFNKEVIFTYRVHIAPVALVLRMHERIAINL